MMDTQTESLWSHILGLAVDGKLKDTELPTIPSDMVTWSAWKHEHPQTTVLNLSRSNKNYTKEFYREPERFVVGFTGKFGIQHCSFATLLHQPLVNIDARGLPLLLSFDPQSTSARLFVRQIDGKRLTFEADDKHRLRDKETNSIWTRAGIAVGGPLKDKHLEPHVGIVSYKRAWLTFHPDSREVTVPGFKVAEKPKPASPAPVRLHPQDLDPFFTPPPKLAENFGKYKSPLKFADGRTVKTADDWKDRREEILRAWHGLMGKWPPLLEKPGVEFLAHIRLKHHTRHMVRVDVGPDGISTKGYLMVPHGEGPFPGVVVVYYDPETGAGKGKELRDFGHQLAQRGFVTLSIGTPPNHYYPSKDNAQLQPLSSLAYAAANCHTALANLEYVDAKRIGIVGHSYGGKWAMFASCLYDKFACAAWSDGGIVFDEQRGNVNYWEPWYLGYDKDVKRKAGIPVENNPRTGAYKRMIESGHDLHELHALMAPRPFLVSGGSEDKPKRWTALNHSVAVNKLLGYKNRVAMSNRDGHSPTAESNEQIYAFFERFLKPSQ